MELSSTYMGVNLPNPIIVSSSNLTSNVESIMKLESFGAGAVVLKSLFEEQIIADKSILSKQDEMYYWYPDAADFLDSFITKEGISEYMKLIEQAKKSVSIPVFASINCISKDKWPEIAANIEQSGADGIELNIFSGPVDVNMTGYQIEESYMDIIHEVRKHIRIPVSVKVGFHFTNLQRMLFKISNMEIDSMVLFNRDFRPDIDINTLRVVSDNILSASAELTLSLRWIALLKQKSTIELVAATGIHNAEAVIKQILAGATSVQICTTLYNNGLEYLKTILNEIQQWMKEKDYPDLTSFRGLVGSNELNTVSFERVQFMKKTAGRIF